MPQYQRLQTVKLNFNYAQVALYEKTLNRDLIENSVHTLRKRIYRIHPPTGEHCQRVADLALLIGDRAGLKDQDLFNLYEASLIHDLGKSTPEFFPIFYKQKLDEADWAIVKLHPQVGAKMAKLEGLEEIAEIIRQHHERADGKGYYSVPQQEILPTSSILTYADSWDAMTENRPYQYALGPRQALEQIKNNIGTQFNSDFFGAFEDTIRSHLVI